MSLVQPVENNGDYELIEEGPASKVSRTWAAVGSDEPQWVVVKSSTTVRKFSKEPHDIAKELRIVSSISHPNIINILSQSEDTEWSILHLWMPFIPVSLPDLLASPHFSSHPFPPSFDEGASVLRRKRFSTVAKSIMYQTLRALAYLHSDTNRIAHRDVKPQNILLTTEGCIKLIDFGIVWKDAEAGDAKQHDIWPESRNKLYFEVSTGPYRAPELLFGTRNYDPFAIDLWSLGATFAEFFTSLRLYSDEEDGEDDYGPHHAGEESQPPKPFILPKSLIPGSLETHWERDTLFNGTRGELGLAWSIFKIRGTPSAENWPEFEHLPDAKGVEFTVVLPMPLAPLLPNLPETENDAKTQDFDFIHSSKEDMGPSVLDFLSRFLVYPSENRLKAVQALLHPWFTEVLVPEGYPSEYWKATSTLTELEGRPLGYWIQVFLSGATE